MINVETLENNALKVQVTGTIDESDFQKIAPRVDQFIKEHGTIKLLVDATGFEGWSSAKAAADHFAFVRDHQKKVERIAIVAGYDWQHWVAGIVSVFVHPRIHVFDKDGIIEAEGWLSHKQAA